MDRNRAFRLSACDRLIGRIKRKIAIGDFGPPTSLRRGAFFSAAEGRIRATRLNPSTVLPELVIWGFNPAINSQGIHLALRE